MSHSHPLSDSKTKSAAFLGLTALTIIAAASGLAAAWPHAVMAARQQSDDLVAAATGAPSAEAAADLRLATWLNRSNQAAYLGLARTQIATGKAEAALWSLERAGEGSEAATLRLHTLIELGRLDEAGRRAEALVQPGRTDADRLLAALCFALAGRTADIAPIKPLMNSPEAAGRLERIAAGKLPLAAELYASGLPESARGILAGLPPSFERNLLLAHIHIDRHTEDDLTKATDFLATATQLNPADIATHRLLAQVYADRNLLADSDAQTALAARLEAGKP